MPLRRPAALGPAGPAGAARGIPEATVARLPLYREALVALAERDVPTVSSDMLAARTGATSAQVRKDLSHLGSYGTRGVGYDVAYLLRQMDRVLGVAEAWAVVIVGVGNLGRALATYRGFGSRGFRVAGLLDRDPARVGERVGAPGEQVAVRPLDDLEAVLRETGAHIGVIATPAPAAQDVCDRLVAAGVTSILNFAPTVLAVPDSVDVRTVDLGVELQILAFHEQQRAEVRP